MNEFQGILSALTPGGAGVWVLVFMLGITIVKGWPKLREIQTNADGSLRQDLLTEVRQLRSDVAAERVSCDAKMAAMEVRHEAQLTAVGSRHDTKVKELESEIKGMRAELQQMALSMTRSIDAPTTLGTTLRRVFPIPGDMQDKLDKMEGDE